MQMYELTLVLPGSFDDKKLKDQLDKLEKIVKDSNGKVSKREDWGKKPLAFPLKKNTEGVYVLYHLELEEVRVNPIARLLQNDDNVLRHLMVKSEGVVSAAPVKEEKPKKEAKVKESKTKISPKKETKTKTKSKAKKK